MSTSPGAEPHPQGVPNELKEARSRDGCHEDQRWREDHQGGSIRWSQGSDIHPLKHGYDAHGMLNKLFPMLLASNPLHVMLSTGSNHSDTGC